MSRHPVFRKCLLAVMLAAPLSAQQQQSTDPQMLQQILNRLTALEEQNRQLVNEVHSLREQLHSAPAPPVAVATPPNSAPSLDEQVAIDKNRIDEQAQTKVEASQKFPLRLNGMLLFNAFANSRYEAGESAADYALLSGPSTSGATFRQTLLGLEFDGPRLPGNGKLNGDLTMDFWSGGPDPGDNWIRLRQARLTFDWANRSFSVGQDQPLISPYQPDSFAEVGVPPLSGAGNLWYWLPQARYEERIRLSSADKLVAQVALLQTEENYPGTSTNILERARPGIEGRLAFVHKFDDTRKFEIGSGFHASESHANGQSIASRIVSVDWLAAPAKHLQISGTFFHGQNVSGLGALNSGIAIDPYGTFHPVHSNGGWTQIAFPLTSRLTWNLFGGLQNDANSYSYTNTTTRDFTYASNLVYRLGPNVIVSLEGLQLRVRDLNGAHEVHNHYDLAIGYLF